MRVSRRAGSARWPNRIATVHAELAAAGIQITDLTDSNPTRHGLTDPRVLAAIERHIYDASRYDPHPRGPEPARAALAEHFGGSPDDYWLTSSTSEAYAWLFTLLADPGDALAVPRPGYPLISPLATYAGLRVVDYRADYVHPDGWLTDPDSLRTGLRQPGLRALVAVNPGNPTGAYADRDGIVGVCAAADIALIADEVFEPFVLDGPGSSFGGEAGAVTFTLGGFSKLLCAPQLKVGWIRLSGPADGLEELREGLDAIADSFLPVSGPVAAAIPELISLADDAVARTRQRLARNLNTLRSMLSPGPYRVRRCDGGWTALVDIPPYLRSEDLAVHLLRSAQLAVHPGWFYDLAEDAVLAISLLPEPDVFATGVGRLRTALERLGGMSG